MRKSNHERLRGLLRERPLGLTTNQLIEATGVKESTIRRSLHSMVDAYVAGWAGPIRGQYVAIWRVVVPPANAPHPTSEKVKAGSSKPKYVMPEPANVDTRIPRTVWVKSSPQVQSSNGSAQS